MKNLEQRRATNAFIAVEAKQFDRSDVAGFPALIIQNGLLAAFAYASEGEKKTRKGLRFACDETAKHLASMDIDVLKGCGSAKDIISSLTVNTATSMDLQRATQEALAFFGYLKRFAAKG